MLLIFRCESADIATKGERGLPSNVFSTSCPQLRNIAHASFLFHTVSLFEKFNIIKIGDLYKLRVCIAIKNDIIRNTQFLLNLA